MSFTDGLQEFLLAVAILNKYGFTHYKDREAVWTKTINQIKVFVVVSQDCGSGSVEVIKDGKHLLNESYGKIPLRGDGEGFIAMLNDRFLNSFNCSITLDTESNKNN